MSKIFACLIELINNFVIEKKSARNILKLIYNNFYFLLFFICKKAQKYSLQT